MSSPDSDDLTKPLVDAKNNNDNADYTANNNCYHEEYKPKWIFALALFPPVLPFFWKYHVDITPTDLSFGYCNTLTCKKVDRDRVVSAEPFDIYPLRQWGGWGIKLRLGRFQTGYIAKGGPGVLVKIRNERGSGSEYVFSCQEPDMVCEILNHTAPTISLARTE